MGNPELAGAWRPIYALAAIMQGASARTLPAMLQTGLEGFACESARKRGACPGDKPSLISWRPFCAEGDWTQGRPQRGRRRRRCASRTLDFNLLPRLAPPKKSMEESNLNPPGGHRPTYRPDAQSPPNRPDGVICQYKAGRKSRRALPRHRRARRSAPVRARRGAGLRRGIRPANAAPQAGVQDGRALLRTPADGASP